MCATNKSEIQKNGIISPHLRHMHGVLDLLILFFNGRLFFLAERISLPRNNYIDEGGPTKAIFHHLSHGVELVSFALLAAALKDTLEIEQHGWARILYS